MKRFFFIALIMAVLCPTVMAKKNEEPSVKDYQISGAGMTSQNAQQVEITIITKSKSSVSDADLEKAAVHGILFRDYDDVTNSGFGSVASHKALMRDATSYAQFKDFFDPFFNNGDYKDYVQVVDSSRRVVKAGKDWKVSAIVRVNTAQLKSMLKKQGMLKDLGGGW